MRRTEQRQGLRMLKLRDVMSRWEAAELSQLEAAELLGMSERTLRRWARRFEADGEAGLADHRLGRRSGRAVPDAAAEEVERLYRERYGGFTAKHFHDHLVDQHKFAWGYTWTKSFLQQRGLLGKAPRRGAHRRKRPRRPLVGMLLHQDASRQVWLAGLGALDLVVTLDDATSAIYSAILVEEEGTMSSFAGLAQVMAAEGLCCGLYTDRGSHYFHTPEAGGKVANGVLTQVGRALGQLGIEHIAAYSPQARGRSSGHSVRCRTGYRRNWRWLGCTMTWRAPTGSSGRCMWRSTTRGLRLRRRRRDQHLCRWMSGNGATCYACRKNARWRRTTRCRGTDVACRSRRIRRGRISCGPRCGCTNIRTARWPSFTVRAAWFAGPLPHPSPLRRGRPREPLSRPAMAWGQDGQAKRLAHLPTGPSPTKAVNSSATCTGHLQVLATVLLRTNRVVAQESVPSLAEPGGRALNAGEERESRCEP